MIDLKDSLGRVAANVSPTRNLDDVHRRVGQHRRRATAVRAAILGATAVTVVALAVLTVSNRPADRVALAPPPKAVGPATDVAIEEVGGLVILNSGKDVSYKASTLNRSDPGALSGPRSIVIRRVDGNITTANAVITFPAPSEADTITPDMAAIPPVLFSMTVDAGGGQAFVIRSANLAGDRFRAIADSISVSNGSPTFTNAAGMPEFAVVSMGTTRPPVIHEARYGCDALGEGQTLGGLCYTGLTTTPGFINALYAHGFTPGPLVNGHLSVISTVAGGSATLAWEPLPGVIAYVGYSGTGRDFIKPLARLANQTAIISPDEWAATSPQTVTQTNDWS